MPTLSLIFSNGFEEGDFSAWTGVADDGGSPESSVIAAAAHSGSYGARLKMTSPGAGNSVWVYKTVTGSPKWVRVTAYIKVVEGTRLYWSSYLALKTAGGGMMWLLFNDFDCYLRRADGSVVHLGVSIAQNTWYKITLEYDQYNGVLRGIIEGLADVSTYPATSEAITEFQLLTGASSPYPSTCYWDDVNHYDESGPPPPPPPAATTLTKVLDCK